MAIDMKFMDFAVAAEGGKVTIEELASNAKSDQLLTSEYLIIPSPNII